MENESSIQVQQIRNTLKMNDNDSDRFIAARDNKGRSMRREQALHCDCSQEGRKQITTCSSIPCREQAHTEITTLISTYFLTFNIDLATDSQTFLPL